MEENVPSKKCSKCDLVKPLSDFTKSKTSHDKLKSRCRDCEKKRIKLWYEKNKEKLNKNNQKSMQLTKEYIVHWRFKKKMQIYAHKDISKLVYKITVKETCYWRAELEAKKIITKELSSLFPEIGAKISRSFICYSHEKFNSRLNLPPG